MELDLHKIIPWLWALSDTGINSLGLSSPSLFFFWKWKLSDFAAFSSLEKASTFLSPKWEFDSRLISVGYFIFKHLSLQALFHPDNERFIQVVEDAAADSSIKSFFCQEFPRVDKFPRGESQILVPFMFRFKIIQKGLLERVNTLKSGAVNPLWLCYE